MKLQNKHRTAYEFILWTILAILFGMVMSFSFLPMFGVNPLDAIRISFSPPAFTSFRIWTAPDC